MVYMWEIELIRHWTTNEIKNCIWAQVSCGHKARFLYANGCVFGP